ncbi:MAG: lamin tail domain-containing protein [Verrucomicrobia bacterium]|nr:lamin tail domain-containing protein [Verrucomicrobiota bacterium]
MLPRNSCTAILALQLPWLILAGSVFAASDSVVVFNEIHYHPADTADGEGVEWIELHNQMGIMTDLSGWRLAGGASYTIPKGTIIRPGGHLVISSRPEGNALGPIEGALSNAGDQLQLFNQSDRLMDEISYGDGGDWPVAPDGSGVTLAKLDPDAATGSAQNWTWSAQIGGTPGTANFPDENEIELTIAEVLTQDAKWRYSEASIDFGSDWANVSHAVGGEWKEGAGVFAFEPTLQDPIGTPLTFPALNDPYATTYYFETDIPFDADTAARVDHLLLSHLVDDGLVVYVNGTEVLRYNMPTGAVTFDTLAIDNIEATWIEDIRIPATDLMAGPNRVSVELHQARPGSSDVVFGARLKMALRPPAFAATDFNVRINEVSAAGAGFWVELKNDGTTAADAGNLVLSISGDPNQEVIIASGTTIPPEGHLLVSSESFPWAVDSNDRVFLLDPSRQVVIDARAVTSRLRGRDESEGGASEDAWLYPTSPTPGATNVMARSNAIVFNEIFYNGPAQVGNPGVPPTLAPSNEFGFDQVWRYDSSGIDPGTGWAGASHPAWPSGAGLLGYDNRAFDDPIATVFAPPNSISPYVITHYFETEWSLSAADLAAIESLALWHYVDDGAIFFVNGVEVGRFAMPAGAVDSTTLATASNEAVLTGPIVVPSNLLIEGVNRVSVEVHQSSSGSSDMVFGLEAITQRFVDAGIPPVRFQKSDEQWIELYNRSDAPVDLSGWNISGGVSFDFPAGMVLAPGAFGVVVNDRALFSSHHPGVAVIGEFSGSISGSSDRLALSDLSDNPVDTVNFYDGGRWPGAADGGGSSLERRDADADSNTAESWAASDTSSASSWRTYSYRGVAAPSAVGPDTQWREFVMGLLFEGEILLDDISVIEEPNSTRAELITNTDFNNGETAWRLLGNHLHSEVIDDPGAPGNKVLRLVATGPTGHMHDHLETTLASRVTNGREYQISFRAKWISGCSQLNTRLYFNRLPMINVIDRPLTGGTPGGRNSMTESNIGPSFLHVRHEPAVPEPLELTTIHATVSDPDGVAGLTVNYSVNDAAYQRATMTPAGRDGDYRVSLPGQKEDAIVHFYITAEDTVGGLSQFPAAGVEGGAAYKVNDGNAAPTALQNFRIVVRNEVRAWMHTDINVMSNDRVPATVIVDEERIYYDVGLRLKGSERARNQNARVGFNVRFNAEEKLRGIHETVSIDRSEGVGTGQFEMLFDVMIANSGGNLSRYYDLIQLIAPQDRHVGGAVLQLTRYEDGLIDSQFGDGSDGTRYEYELIYYPTSANAAGYKRPEPDGVVGTPVRDLGDDKERYRWNFLIKDDREEDTFEPIIAYCKHFSKRGAAFEEGLEEVVDIDNWLRGMAYAVASGAGDNAGDGSQHNGMYYARPDGRVMFLPHDMDFAFDASRTITANPEAAKIVAIPKYARIYYGHLQDLVETTFNRAYMQQWTAHFAELLPRQPWNSHLNYINSRSNNLLSQIRSRAREIDFATTSAPGQSTDSTSVTLKGTGWVNIRKIRLAGSDGELNIEWTDETDWQVQLPVSPGNNGYVLEAVDFSGKIVGTVEWTAIGTGTLAPASSANLRISEINYHPADLTPSEIQLGVSDPDALEFIELWNFSATTIDLSGTWFSNGITYAFDANTRLAAGQRWLLVRDAEAFGIRYTGIKIDGTFSGTGLSNSGERITLLDGLGREIVNLQYNDKAPWPEDADGTGYTLVFGSGDASVPASWLPSARIGGTPGSTDTIPFAQWSDTNGVLSANSDDDKDGNPAIIEYLCGSLPGSPSQLLAPQSNLLLTYPVSLTSEGIPLRLQASINLADWQEVSDQAEFLSHTHNHDDASATATWRIQTPGHFFRLSAVSD